MRIITNSILTIIFMLIFSVIVANAQYMITGSKQIGLVVLIIILTGSYFFWKFIDRYTHQNEKSVVSGSGSNRLVPSQTQAHTKQPTTSMPTHTTLYLVTSWVLILAPWGVLGVADFAAILGWAWLVGFTELYLVGIFFTVKGMLRFSSDSVSAKKSLKLATFLLGGTLIVGWLAMSLLSAANPVNYP